MSETLIWNDLEKGLDRPVCNRLEATEIEEGVRTNTNLVLVEINSDLYELILKVFHFEDTSSLYTLNVSRLIITKEKKHDINTLIRSEDLAGIANFIFLIIAAINKRVSDIRQYQSATKETFGLDVRNYAKDEGELENIIEYYRDCHIAKEHGHNDPLAGKQRLKSITFTFSDKKTDKTMKSIKIGNFLLLHTIMGRIMKGGGIDPIISEDWDTKVTNFKQMAARSLLHFFMLPDPPLNGIIKRNAHAHRIIAEIFTLTDSGEVDEALVKKWIERANEKE